MRLVVLTLALVACADPMAPSSQRAARDFCEANGLTKANGFGPPGCWNCDKLCCSVFRVEDGATVSFSCRFDGAYCALMAADYPKGEP